MGSTINKQLDQYLSNLIHQTDSYREHLIDHSSTVSFSIVISDWFKQQNQVHYILLKGDLGAGKTTFSKHFISNICSTDINHITSPTFQFLHIYDKKICHFDLYRLSNESEFIELGLQIILIIHIMGVSNGQNPL